MLAPDGEAKPAFWVFVLQVCYFEDSLQVSVMGYGLLALEPIAHIPSRIIMRYGFVIGLR